MSLREQARTILEREFLACKEYLGIEKVPIDIHSIKIEIGSKSSPSNNTLSIPEPFLQSESLLRAIIRYFVFNLFVPSNLKEVEEAKDLAMLYAYIGLENDERARSFWLRLWQQQSPEKDFGGRFTYRPVLGFTYFNNVSNGMFLREIMSLFWRLKRYGEKLDFEKYALILEEYMTKYAAKFSNKDKLILEYILREQPIRNSEIASALGIKETTLSNRLNALKRRYILIWRDRINFSLIGLATYLIFFEKGENWSEVLTKLREHPYFYTSHEIPFSGNPALLVFLGPATNTYYEKLEKFAKTLSEYFNDSEYSIVRLDGLDYRGENIRLYNNKKGSWDISWYSWGMLLKKIMKNEVFLSQEPKVREIEVTVAKKLDEKDLEILEYVWKNKEISFVELRKKLKIGTNRLNEKLRFFRDKKVIYKEARASMLGLVESALLIGRSEKNEVLKIIRAFSELPEVTVSWSKSSKKLISLIKLPEGGIQGMISAIKLFYPDLLSYKLYASTVTYGAYWKFRKELFNTEKQAWEHKDIEIDL